MVTLKINNLKQDLIASEDITLGRFIFSSFWVNQFSENPFFIPKKEIDIKNLQVAKIDDLFLKVALSGFGEYIKPSNQNANTKAEIDWIDQKVNFFAIRNIKKNDILTYILDTKAFPNVKIQ